MNLNLHDTINPLIGSLVNNQSITICLPVTAQNASYKMVTTYTEATTLAQIQLANNQKLIHKDYYQQNKVYKRFYLNSNNLTGLNRNIGTNGDYIKWNNLFYKIVEVNYNFLTGWVNIIGCESTDFTSG